MSRHVALTVAVAAVLSASVAAPALADTDNGLPDERLEHNPRFLDLPRTLAVDEARGRALSGGTHGLLVTDARGGDPRPVPGVVSPTSVELSPDGRTYAVASAVDGAVLLVDAETLAVTRVGAPGSACPADVTWVGRTVHAIEACRSYGHYVFTVDADTLAVGLPASDPRFEQLLRTNDVRSTGVAAARSAPGLVVTSTEYGPGGLQVWDVTGPQYQLVGTLEGSVQPHGYAVADDGRSVVVAGSPSRRYSLPDLAPLAELPRAGTVATAGSVLALADTTETDASFDGTQLGSPPEPAVLHVLDGDRVVRDVRAGQATAVHVGPSGTVRALVRPREAGDSVHLLTLDGRPETATRVLHDRAAVVQPPLGGSPLAPGRTPLAESVDIAVRLVDVDGGGLAGRDVEVTRTGPDGTFVSRLRTGDKGLTRIGDRPLLVGHYDYVLTFRGEAGRSASSTRLTHEVQQRGLPFTFADDDDPSTRAQDAVADGLGQVWVSQPGQDRVLVLAGGRVPVGSVAVPGARGMELSPDGSRLLVAAHSSNEVVQIDVLTRTVVDRRDVRPAYGPHTVSTDGDRTYVGFCGPEQYQEDQALPNGEGSLAWLDLDEPPPGTGATTEERNGVTVWRTPPGRSLDCYDVSADRARPDRVVAVPQFGSREGAHVVDVPEQGAEVTLVRSIAAVGGVQLLDAGTTVLTGPYEVAVDTGAREVQLPYFIDVTQSAAGVTLTSAFPDVAALAYRRADGRPLRSVPVVGAFGTTVAFAIAPDGSAAYAVTADQVAPLDLRPALLERLTAVVPSSARLGEPVALSGRLTEKASGQGIGGAPLEVVRVAADGARTTLPETTTAADGTWRLTDLPPRSGAATYLVRHVGHLAWSSAAGRVLVAEPDSPPSSGQAPAARTVEDACPADLIPEDGFDDVVEGETHESAVDCILWWRLARGRTADLYAPGADVTRGQMATFITNLLLSTGATLPEPTVDRFTDDAGPHERSIGLLAEAGVVSGVGDGTYRPDEVVARGQMATFLVRAFELRSGRTLTSDVDWFRDDDGTTHEANIDRAAAAGLTGGTASGYQPGAPVRRSSMASFLARELDLLVDDGITTPPRF